MKRCDLHIHTVPSVSDRMFTYDKDVLLDYVAKTKLDVIAITNHNLFDYAQYQEINLMVEDAINGIQERQKLDQFLSQRRLNPYDF